MGSVVLKPVAQKGYWRVQMAWPNKKLHFVGKFNSQAEAEEWIEQFGWLTNQQEPDVADTDDPKVSNDC